MPDTIDTLITHVSDKIGVDPIVAKKSLGAVVSFLKKQSTNEMFQKLLSIDGVDDLDKEPESEAAVRESPQGTVGVIGIVLNLLKTFGVLTYLKQLASSLPMYSTQTLQLIEGVEDGAELTVILQRMGINRNQSIKMVTMFVDFVTKKLDPDIVEKIVTQVPAIKAFLTVSQAEEGADQSDKTEEQSSEAKKDL